MSSISAICENGGETVVTISPWVESDNEYAMASDGKGRKKLIKGICGSKICEYIGRCTLKVLFDLRKDDDSVIYESRWKMRNQS